MALIKDLIQIPDRVHQGDFVLKLTEGVSQADATLRQYVVTPQLARAFDEALGFVQKAVDSGQSKAAYLHGSFGAGKSHFMAVLHLLLSGNLQARALTELADVVARHGWVQGRRFLMVPYHMVGAVDMESAVLGQYADHVRRLHPEAPIPGFYQAEGLFRDARQLRAQMGDAAFFAKLNESTTGTGGGWGALASWSPSEFEAAMLEPPAGPERVRLVGDLINTYFTAYRGRAVSQEQYVGFDEGLAIMSAHAADLGYDGVILFLDELVLWLASHAADVGFVSREGTKLVKLVEATNLQRPLPLISFIARQRDLRELVGDSLPGAIGLQFTDVLRHWEARFHKITLEDRNLPAIAQKRVLRPVSEAARAQLTQAVEETFRLRRDVLETLLTSDADRDLFAKVYPFSPALVQTLIAVSAALQRERTALKLMLQLLVDRRDDLEVGQLIPVGDLWDVIADGDEPFSDAMRVHFDNAKRLYAQRLLPVLEQRHGTTWEAVRIGQAPPDKAKALRNDARLLKTLLLAALVPEVESLKALTAARLTALNHGTFRTPIAGQEPMLVLRKLRDWAGEIGELKVGEDANPLISIQITGVDLEPILRAAEANDNEGNRRKLVRDLLFKQLGIDESPGLFTRHEFDWRHTKRDVDVVYENVWQLADDRLKGRGDGWTVVLDYPFDPANNRTPQDDLARLNEYRGGSTRTVVWLPSFLSARALQDLGRLVILDHLLQGDRFEQAAAHLSLVDRTQARALASNQRDSLRAKLKAQLEVVYGIAPEPRDAIGYALAADQHLRSLDPTFSPRPPVGADLGAAFRDLLDQMLAHQYPAHPHFEGPVEGRYARELWKQLQPALESPDRRANLDAAARRLVRSIVPALRLGETGENNVVLGDRWNQHFVQCMAREGVVRPTVGQLRAWMDEPRPMGLPAELQDLVILCFAAMTSRHFTLNGGPCPVEIGRLGDTVELREQQLPDASDWEAAVQRAGQLFGLATPTVLNAANVAFLVAGVRDKARERRKKLQEMVEALESRIAEFVGAGVSPRLTTARSAHALLASIQHADGDDVVRVLGTAELQTSPAAVGRVFGNADALLVTLGDPQWGVLRALREVQDHRRAAADVVLASVADALSHDEHVQALADALLPLWPKALAALSKPSVVSAEISAIEVSLPQPAPQPAVGPVEPAAPDTEMVEEDTRSALSAADGQALLDRLRRRLADDPTVEISLSWRLQRRRPR